MSWAKGDVFATLVSVATNALLSTAPPSNIEADIHNIFWEATTDLLWATAGGTLNFWSSGGKGGFFYYTLHVRNDIYVQVLNNNSDAARKIGFSGVITRA